MTIMLNRFLSTCASLSIFTACLFSSPILSGFDTTGWDPEGYHKNSQWQKASAESLILQGYPFKGNEAVLDIGCGDGKVSAFLAKLVPQGSVIALDLSPAMVAFAQKNYPSPNLKFELGDVTGMTFENQFDLATSFTSMHLVKDQKDALAAIYRSLKPDGKVLMQFPAVDGFDGTLAQLIAEPKWAKQFEGFDSGWYFYFPKDYKPLLKQAGFTPVRVEITRLEETYPSKEAFKKCISYWLPHLRQLSDSNKEAFLNDLVDKYVEKHPLDAEGKLHYIVDRIEVDADKKRT